MPKVYSQESMKGLLNVKYYKILKNKYEISDENTIDNLSQSMILHKFHDKNVIFTYPDNYDYSGIVNLLYENLLVLSKTIALGQQMVQEGVRDSGKLVQAMKEAIAQEPLARIDYVEAVSMDTIQPVETIQGRVLVAMAVFIGKTRLIDNFIVEV